MANPNIKFFKGASAPAGASRGAIWFNTTAKTIEVCVGDNTWEKYAGKLVDATWNGSILTINKADGSNLQLDFSDVASLSGVQTVLTNLQNQITANTEAIGDSTKGLVKGVADNAAAIATEKSRAEGAEQALGGRIDGVASDIATETSERKAADEAMDGRLDTLEAKITGLNGTLHFRGVQDTAPENPVQGDFYITTAGVEYIYDGEKWEKLGDTSAESAAISELQTAVAQNKAAIESNDGDITALQGRATELETRATNLENSRATKEELNAAKADLQGQITANDGDITALQGRATDVEGRATTLEGKVSALETASATHATKEELNGVDAKVSANTSNLATAMSDIDDLEKDVADLKDKRATKEELAAVEAQVKSNDTDIANLQSKDAELVAEDSRLAGLIAENAAAAAAAAKAASDEAARAKGEESRIEGKVDTEKSRAEAAEAALAGRVSTLEGLMTWGSFE